MDMGPQPIENRSTATVVGADVNWANGVAEEIHRFFAHRTNLRGWLHRKHIYDVLVVVLGFPLSLSFVYLLYRFAHQRLQLPDPLLVAVFVYIVLVFLWSFRLSFNYAKWVYSKIEIDAPQQTAAFRHKAVLGFIALALASILIGAVLKAIGIG
jgi:hypothetical protein